jgi:hypothetical protein
VDGVEVVEVLAEVLGASAAAAVAAGVPIEVFNQIIRCKKWQKYQNNHRKCLFL